MKIIYENKEYEIEQGSTIKEAFQDKVDFEAIIA